MANQTVPLNSNPNQTFQCVLTVDGGNKTLEFFIFFNAIAGVWMMKITDPKLNVIVIDSVPLVPSLNILRQHAHMRIGSAYVVNVSEYPLDMPTSENMGTDFILVWGDTEL